MSTIGEEDHPKIQKIVELASDNSSFRSALVQNPAGAIDQYSGDLQFNHNDLSEQVLGLLASLTEEELDTIAELKQKAKKFGIDSSVMMPL